MIPSFISLELDMEVSSGLVASHFLVDSILMFFLTLSDVTCADASRKKITDSICSFLSYPQCRHRFGKALPRIPISESVFRKNANV